MKKLIVLSVVFVLLASAAFAADVSGEVHGHVTPISGDTEEDSKVQAGGGLGRVRIEASGQDEDGVFGGWVRVDGFNTQFVKSDWTTKSWEGAPIRAFSGFGIAWWKPNDKIKVSIGGNPDGQFGMDGVARWGFYQVGGDSVGVFTEGWKFSASFYGGWADEGALLTITPIDALQINIAVPFMSGSDQIWGSAEARFIYLGTNAQVAYTIDGIGKAALSYVGNQNYLDINEFNEDIKTWAQAWDGKKAAPNPSGYASGGTLYGYFGLTMIEGLGIDVGIGYTLPVSNSEKFDVDNPSSPTAEASYNAPIAVGLGVNFTTGPIGLKLRAQGQFAGESTYTVKDSTGKIIELTDPADATKKKKADETFKDPTVIIVDILPSYAITDALKVYLDAGLEMTMPDKGDTVVGWHVAPVISVKSNWWSPNFFAGIRIDSDGQKAYGKKKDSTKVNWSVPIGMAVSF